MLSRARPAPLALTGLAAEAWETVSQKPVPLSRPANCSAVIAQALRRLGPAALFPEARSPAAALSGLLLLLGCWDDCHAVSQDIDSPEGNYWHAIAHRIEPDSANAGYWFRRVGTHPIFDPLHSAAAAILHATPNIRWQLEPAWDPFLFITWCDEARKQTGGERERAAQAIQQKECLLLFEWCASP